MGNLENVGGGGKVSTYIGTGSYFILRVIFVLFYSKIMSKDIYLIFCLD